MKNLTDYSNEIIGNKMDMEYINWMLNDAIRNETIVSKDYQYICSIAKSFGFKFGKHFNLI